MSDSTANPHSDLNLIEDINEAQIAFNASIKKIASKYGIELETEIDIHLKSDTGALWPR